MLEKRSEGWLRSYLDGKSFETIAQEADEALSVVSSAIYAALDRQQANDEKAGRAREQGRMNRLIEAMMPLATAGDVKAASVVVKASGELSRLGGFYPGDKPPPTAPVQTGTERVARLRSLLESPDPDLAEALALAGWSRR